MDIEMIGALRKEKPAMAGNVITGFGWRP